MSDAAASPSPSAEAPRLPIGWVGAMSLLLAAWVYRNHEPRSWIPVGLLVLVGVKLTIASFLRLSAGRAGLIYLFAGAAHGIAGAVLLASWGLTAAGEWISAFVFAAACATIGVRSFASASHPAAASADDELKAVGQGAILRNVLIVAAIVCVAGCATLLYVQRTISTLALPKEIAPAVPKADKAPLGGENVASWDWKYGPETAALAILALLFAATGLRLLAQPSVSAADVRTSILVAGGGTGFASVLMLLGRALLWRDELFLVGAAANEAQGAWRFWVWSYALLAALGLMFVSLTSVRRQVRDEPALRRMLFGYDVVFRSLLFFALLFLLNILVHYVFPFNYNWSKARGLQSLSPASTNLIASLKKPVHVYALLPRNYAAYGEMLHVLENAKGVNAAFHSHQIDPDVDKSEYKELALRFKVLTPDDDDPRATGGRGLLATYGDLPSDPDQTPPHAFISEKKLYEQQQSGLVFKGESELMKEIYRLVQAKEKQKIYILQGHDELDVRAPEGLPRRDPRQVMQPLGAATLVDQLQKENYEVRGLSLAKEFVADKDGKVVAGPLGTDQKREIPPDAFALIVPGPSAPFSQDELSALSRYMDRGGRMLIHFDVIADQSFSALKKSGLEEFLRRYNVDVADEFVLSLETGTEDLTICRINVPPRTENRLAKQFAGRRMAARTVRVIRPIEQPGPFKVETLLQCEVRPNRPSWAEGTVGALRNPFRFAQELNARNQFESRIVPKAIPIAVAVSEGKDDAAKPRLVVFGDAEMVSNIMLTLDRQETMLDLEIASLAWLADSTGYVGPRPIETPFYKASPDTRYGAMFFLSGWTILLGVASLGLGLWLVRRR